MAMTTQNPILDEPTLNRAVTELFKRDLKDHLMKEAEAVVDKTVEDLSDSIQIMTKAFLNHGLDSFQPTYQVIAKIEDKRK